MARSQYLLGTEGKGLSIAMLVLTASDYTNSTLSNTVSVFVSLGCAFKSVSE